MPLPPAQESSAQHSESLPKRPRPSAQLLGTPVVVDHSQHALRNLLLIATVISLISFISWGPIGRNLLHWPIDFGPLTAVCFFLLAFVIHGFTKFQQHLRKVTYEKSELSPANLIYIIVAVVAFLGAGYFEYRHQSVQIKATPIIRKISGISTALAQCDRLVNNLMAPTRSGYTYITDGIAHFHPSACAEIFDWYFWQGKTDTTDRQIHQLDMISHEAVHIGGVYNELTAKCASTEWTEDVLLHLGAKPDEAKRVAQRNRLIANNYQGRGAGSQTDQYEGNCEQLPDFRKP